MKITLGKPYNLEGVDISSSAQDLINKIVPSKEVEEVELVIKTVAELGMKNGGTLEDIYAKAKEQGLELCPPETALHLLKEWGDSWATVAMETITVRGGYPRVFYLHLNGAVLWLDAGSARPSDGWDADDEFVFRARKSFDSEPFNINSLDTLTLSTFVPHAPKIEKVYCYCRECTAFWKEWSDNKEL